MSQEAAPTRAEKRWSPRAQSLIGLWQSTKPIYEYRNATVTRAGRFAPPDVANATLSDQTASPETATDKKGLPVSVLSAGSIVKHLKNAFAVPEPPENALTVLSSGSQKPQAIFEHVEGTRIPRWLLPLAAFIALVAGTANLLLVKWSGRQITWACGNYADPACAPVQFKAPLAQQACNCFGQAVCLPLYGADVFLARSRGHSKGWLQVLDGEQDTCKPKPKVWIFLVPALCDYVGSVLILEAMYMSSASNVQVLRNFNLVVCALLSIVWLGATLKVFHWFGIAIMTIGFIMVAVDSAIHPELDFAPKHPWLGAVLAIVGTSLSAFQLVFEEQMFRRFACPTFKAVGWIGSFEIVLTALTILVAHYTGIENAKVVSYQAFHDRQIKIALIIFTFSVALFTTFGLMITKCAAALLTASVFSARQVFLWVGEILLGWNEFYYLTCFGILFVIFGFFVYNHLLPVRFCHWYDDLAVREWRWEIYCFCADNADAYHSDYDDYSDGDSSTMNGSEQGYGLRHFISPQNHPRSLPKYINKRKSQSLPDQPKLDGPTPHLLSPRVLPPQIHTPRNVTPRDCPPPELVSPRVVTPRIFHPGTRVLVANDAYRPSVAAANKEYDAWIIIEKK